MFPDTPCEADRLDDSAARNAGSHPARSQASLLRNRNPQYIFQKLPAVETLPDDREGNHTKDGVLPLSFPFGGFLHFQLISDFFDCPY